MLDLLIPTILLIILALFIYSENSKLNKLAINTGGKFCFNFFGSYILFNKFKLFYRYVERSSPPEIWLESNFGIKNIGEVEIKKVLTGGDIKLNNNFFTLNLIKCPLSKEEILDKGLFEILRKNHDSFSMLRINSIGITGYTCAPLSDHEKIKSFLHAYNEIYKNLEIHNHVELNHQ